jgi:YVTN family beta-propeller protein
MPLGVAFDARADRAFVTNAGDNTTSIIDAASGRLLRTLHVGAAPVGVAVDSRTGRAFVSNNGSNTVSIIDTHTGVVLGTRPVGWHPARVVVDERTGRVFIVHGRGSTTGCGGNLPNYQQAGVTVLDARTAAVLRSVPVGGSPFDDDVGYAPLINIALDTRRDRVFVINQPRRDRHGVPVEGNGSVSVLDARSGALLQTINVGRHPISLAVDERTARLFVVNTNMGCTPRNAFSWLPSPARRLLGLGPLDTACHGSVTVIDTTRV